MRSQRPGDEHPRPTSGDDAFESLFAAAVDGLVLFDAGGNITRMNPAARAMVVDAVGHTPVPTLEVLRCVRVTDVEGAVVPYEQLPMYAALRGETVPPIPLALHRLDGTRLWASVGAAPVRDRDGGVVGAVLSLGDVSRLRDLQEQREDLTSMITHDLRAPLAVILGRAHLLDRRADDPSAVREAAAAITKSAKRMAAMLEDLLESALLEAGKLRLARARMDLAVAIPELCEQLAPSTEPGRLRIERAGTPVPVLADPDRLDRILVNLVTNALKYSPPETEVIVRVARDGAHAVVEVQDHGQGIAPEDLPHLFERYFRASGSSRLQGMGLGLYTARVLAEAHGGTITVSTVRGEGSIFRLRLPTVV